MATNLRKTDKFPDELVALGRLHTNALEDVRGNRPRVVRPHLVDGHDPRERPGEHRIVEIPSWDDDSGSTRDDAIAFVDELESTTDLHARLGSRLPTAQMGASISLSSTARGIPIGVTLYPVPCPFSSVWLRLTPSTG